jgi:hypothetical protein
MAAHRPPIGSPPISSFLARKAKITARNNKTWMQTPGNWTQRAQAMTQAPAKRIPQWLRIDLLVIVVSLAIIGIYIFYIA